MFLLGLYLGFHLTVAGFILWPIRPNEQATFWDKLVVYLSVIFWPILFIVLRIWPNLIKPENEISDDTQSSQEQESSGNFN